MPVITAHAFYQAYIESLILFRTKSSEQSKCKKLSKLEKMKLTVLQEDKPDRENLLSKLDEQKALILAKTKKNLAEYKNNLKSNSDLENETIKWFAFIRTDRKRFYDHLYYHIHDILNLDNEDDQQKARELIESYWLPIKYGFPDEAENILSEMRAYRGGPDDKEGVFLPFMDNLKPLNINSPTVGKDFESSLQKDVGEIMRFDKKYFDAAAEAFDVCAYPEEWITIGDEQSNQVTYCNKDNPLNHSITVSSKYASLSEPKYGDTELAIRLHIASQRAQGKPGKGIINRTNNMFDQIEAYLTGVNLGLDRVTMFDLDGNKIEGNKLHPYLINNKNKFIDRLESAGCHDTDELYIETEQKLQEAFLYYLPRENKDRLRQAQQARGDQPHPPVRPRT